LDLADSGIDAVAGCCEHGDKPSELIKGGGFVDHLRNCQFTEQDTSSMPHLLLNAVFFSVARGWVLVGAVVLGALVVCAIILASTMGGEEPVAGAAVLDIVPLIDG
jgi:hypothetical protein